MSENYQPKTITAEPITAEPIGRPRGKMPEVPGKPGVSLEMPLEERPLALLSDPYLVDYLDIKSLYNDNIDGLKKKVDLVDSWAKRQILDRGYAPNAKSYEAIIKELKEIVGISDLESRATQAERLFLYIYLGVSGKKVK